MPESGYSNNPLSKKLGYKAGFHCLLLEPPEHYFNLLSHLPEHLHFVEPHEAEAQSLDFIHMFLTEAEGYLEVFQELAALLKKDGIIWVSWPKQSSGLQTTLNGTIVRETILKHTDFVDVKVCSVDATWSGLKFYLRKDKR